MNNRNTENRIKTAFENAVPDVLDSILADLPSEEKSHTSEKPQKWYHTKIFRKAIAIAATFVILLGSLFGAYKYHDAVSVSSTVFLDVNPSIEIKVNSRDVVLSVTSKNADGDKIIEGMNFDNSNLDITVNAIVSSMMKHGYISDISNSILISVNSSDSKKSSELRSRLAKDVERLLDTDSFSGAVLSQTMDDPSIDSVSEKYGITPGKAQLILKISDSSELYTLDDLAALSINELCLIASSNGINIDDVDFSGCPSDKAYIGIDGAMESAMNYANLSSIDTENVDSETELTLKDGIMVYEIKLNYSGNNYGFTINASDGSIVMFKNDAAENDTPPVPNSSEAVTSAPEPNADHGTDKTTSDTTVQNTETIETAPTPIESGTTDTAEPEPTVLPVNFTPDDARLIASRHANLNRNTNSVIDLTCTSYVDNGTPMYKIRFYSTNFRKKNGVQFDYTVNAYSGTVISSKETKAPYYIPSTREVFVPYLRSHSGIISSYTYYEYSGYSLSYITSELDLTSTPMCVNSSNGCVLKFDSRNDIDTLIKMIEDANLTSQGMDGYEARAFISDLSKYDEAFFGAKRLYLIPVQADSNVSDINPRLFYDNNEDKLILGADMRYRKEKNDLPVYTFFLVEAENSVFTQNTTEIISYTSGEDQDKTEVTKKYHMHAYLNENK
ncbi:MAG: hypothetical protein E7578_03420 [Ruminococcaceae bacterium]|nr:hypothetical protein [Oscillospiraceae bacterium]